MRAWAALGAVGGIVFALHAAEARVVWMDDFSDDIVSVQKHKPSRSYVRSGEDYVLTEPSPSIQFFASAAGSYDLAFKQPSTATLIGDNNNSREGSMSVTMDRFDDFDTAGPDRLFHFQFDLGVQAFQGTNGPRFVLKPDNASTSNLVLGFAAQNVLSSSGVEMFFYAMTGGTTDDPIPTKADVLGLNEDGSAFLDGFNFGTRSSDPAENDTLSPNALFPDFYYELYRFSVTFDGTTYSGTVNRINSNGVLSDDPDDTATFSITVPSASLSSTDSGDRFIVYTGIDNGEMVAGIDNIEFSVTPEPTGTAALAALAATMALRRRRRR